MVPGSSLKTSGMFVLPVVGIDFSYKKNPPDQPQPEQPPQSQYQPSPFVVEQNEGFIYALSIAPNVLYQKYKEFGQVTISPFLIYEVKILTIGKKVGRAGLVFRIWRAHRQPERIGFLGQHVCDNEGTSTESMRGDFAIKVGGR